MEKAFDSIAGYKEEKKELQDICTVIKRREELKKAGGKLPKGIFLLGPTGVGKTKLAKAFIKESKCPMIEITSNEMDSKTSFSEYIKKKFQFAAALAPCILLIDELDKYVGTDSFLFGSSTKSQDLLTEINNYIDVDGLFLFLIGNNDRSIDDALVRSGRVDKKIVIFRPNESEREEIIRFYAKNKTFEESFDYSNLAKITNTFSGADIESLINDATMKSVTNGHKCVTNEDVMSAYNDKCFKCKSKVSAIAENSEVVAYHEAGHIALNLLSNINTVFYASITPIGSASGLMNSESSEKKAKTLKDVEQNIQVALAGVAAEEVFMHQRTIGAVSDIGKAQKSISDLIRKHGKCGFDKLDSYIKFSEFDSSGNICSQHKIKLIERFENKLFKKFFRTTKHLIKKNKNLVIMLSDALKEKKVLNKSEIFAIYNNYKNKLYAR